MTPRPFPQDDRAMEVPELVLKAVRQSIEMGTTYIVIPIHSYEAWALNSGLEHLDGWSYLQDHCWEYDDQWDDELILFCVKPKGHEGECGKPGTRHLHPEQVR